MEEERFVLVGHTLADRWGTLLAVDPKVCEIMQREERELIGVGFQTLTHPDDCQRNVAEVSGLRVGAGPYHIRKRYIRPDGSVVWADIQVSRLRDGAGDRLVSTIQLMDASPKEFSPEGLLLAGKREFHSVQLRRQMMGNDLFLDYGWLVLLQIYMAVAEGRIATVGMISDTATMRLTLVSKWLEVLVQKGLVERGSHLSLPLQLTALGFRKIEHLLRNDDQRYPHARSSPADR